MPERKWPFLPISASTQNCNPRNTHVCLRLKFWFSLILTKNPHFRSGTKYGIKGSSPFLTFTGIPNSLNSPNFRDRPSFSRFLTFFPMTWEAGIPESSSHFSLTKSVSPDREEINTASGIRFTIHSKWWSIMSLFSSERLFSAWTKNPHFRSDTEYGVPEFTKNKRQSFQFYLIVFLYPSFLFQYFVALSPDRNPSFMLKYPFSAKYKSAVENIFPQKSIIKLMKYPIYPPYYI